jgi:uncharacterized protein (TIGR03067 family)
MSTKARWLTPVLLITLASAATARGDDEKVSGDLKKMQGTWVYNNAQGEEQRWTFEGDTLKAMVGGNMYVSKLTLDSKAEPLPIIDFKITEGPDNAVGMMSLGVYKFEGETLTFCISFPGVAIRPKEFKRVEGESFMVMLKRAK